MCPGFQMLHKHASQMIVLICDWLDFRYYKNTYNCDNDHQLLLRHRMVNTQNPTHFCAVYYQNKLQNTQTVQCFS